MRITHTATADFHKTYAKLIARQPSQRAVIPVRDRDADGQIFVTKEKWPSINSALVQKTRRVAGIDATSLTDFKRQHDYTKRAKTGPKAKTVTPATPACV